MTLFQLTPADREKGFTLGEMLVAVAILGLIMAGLLSIWMTGNTSYLTGINQVQAQENARVALDRIARDIRGAGFNPRQAAAFNVPIVGSGVCPNNNVPTATAFMVINDNSADGAIQNTECILYVLNGANLDRQDFSVDAAPLTVIGGVQALTLIYFDQAGTQLNFPPAAVPAASVPLIRSIQINITTQPETLPGSWQAGAVAVTMSDRIRLRNQ
ncbi:MAG TPA: prepilin-type N-terminal cleavage/methylation domain-containing protein [Methylomirabilota bacterium]|nr:prepilin-type N-terminal cleavage/methylation domain-containing protein [Methylomirabilota bacterium]